LGNTRGVHGVAYEEVAAATSRVEDGNSAVVSLNPATNARETKGAWTLNQKEDAIVFEGEATEALKGGHFRIVLENGHNVLGHLSGKMRKNRIRVLPGDRVQVELSPYDLTRARITYRYK